MRLKTFRIQKYKTIKDTGWVEVRPDVAAFIGVNEAGKSSVLQALWKFNNVANASYDMLYDYPRDLYSRERETGKSTEVVTATFELDDADKKAYLAEVGGASPRHVYVVTTYANKKTCWVSVPMIPQATAAVDALKNELDALERSKKTKAEKQKGEPVRASLAEYVALTDKYTDDRELLPILERLKVELEQLADLVDAEIRTGAESFLQDHAARYDVAEQWVLKHLPTFIYFEEYGSLHTRIHLPEFVRKKKANPVEPLVRTQSALFEWAQLGPEEILKLGGPKTEGETLEGVQRRKEERSTLLESASYHLTGDWIEWWDQRHHELKIEADGEDLILKVSDDKNPWKVPFQERSKGFQWFFSFYLTFLVESQKAHHGAILLLDEPGLHLHIRAQQKLIGFFRRVSSANQVIYSTHSPFMVDPDHLDNVRTVYLSEDPTTKRSFTKVSIGTEPEGDADTLLPLQAAFGYELAQTLFIGRRVLLVEGITDYWLLKALSTTLATAGRHALAEDVVLVFAGGTSHMMPLVSLFIRPDREDQELVVLLDADKAGLNKASQLKRDLMPGGKGVALISDADLLAIPDTEVEDVLERGDLMAALSAFKGRQMKLPPVPASTNVLLMKQVYAAEGLGDFSHAEKAQLILHLIDTWRNGTATPSTQTLSRAETVFAGLAGRFT